MTYLFLPEGNTHLGTFKWPNCVNVAADVCLICLFVMTTLLYLTLFGVKAAHQYSWWWHLVIWDWTTLLTSINFRRTQRQPRHLQRCLPGQLGTSKDVTCYCWRQVGRLNTLLGCCCSLLFVEVITNGWPVRSWGWNWSALWLKRFTNSPISQQIFKISMRFHLQTYYFNV